MNQNTTMIVAGVLVVAVAVLGWLYWQETQKNSVSLQFGNGSITLDAK
jgi:predicted negative regulator of RcsB-dependent stress response